MFFQRLQYHNPILERELRHQRSTARLWAQRLDVFGVVAAALVIFAGMIIYCINIRDYYLGYSFYGNYENLQVILLVFGVVYILAILRGVLAGVGVMNTQSINSFDWDLLVLAGLNTRQILIGKWWMALRQIRGWVVALGIIRIGLVAAFAGQHSFYFFFYHTQQLGTRIGNCESYYGADLAQTADCIATLPSPPMVVEWPVSMPILLGMGIIITLLEGAACTGIGIASALIFKFNGIAAFAGMFLRALPVWGLLIFPNYRDPYVPHNLFLWWYSYTWFALLDGGTTALMRGSGLGIQRNTPQAIYFPFMVAVTFLSLYIVLAWIGSSMMLRRRGVLKT